MKGRERERTDEEEKGGKERGEKVRREKRGEKGK